jgi:hypothetical protein
MAETGFAERASLVQRDMVSTVRQFRPAKARTLATFKENTRSKEARLAGLQIPYWKDHAHGSGVNAPIIGDTSFKKSIKQESGAMYAGVAFRYMNFYMEATVMRDMQRGYIPDSYIKERQRRIGTHMMKKNWAAIGDGTGTIAVVASAGAGVLTCTADNAGRLRSKGSFRLKTSSAADPLLYDAVNATTDAVVATFYVTAKPSTTQANVTYTFGDNTALNVAGLRICESGWWKKEMIGIAGHISDANRIYQGADTAVDDFLKNPNVDGGNAAVTPSAVHSAKGIMMTRANAEESDFSFLCHLTWGNYRTLAKYGYTFRTYNAEGGKANKTFGLPNVYEDGDTIFVPDSDYEDGYIDFRERKPYFEYVQKPFGLHETGGQSRQQWIGAYQAGSTNEYENYTENCNIVWDGRGADGDGDEGGSPNSAVFISNLAIPAENQRQFGV